MNKTILLKPAIFSKAKTADIFKKHLKLAPEQKPNSPAAFKGHVLEFISYIGPDYGQPVGTLTEFANTCKCKNFKIYFRNNDKLKIIKQNEIFKII